MRAASTAGAGVGSSNSSLKACSSRPMACASSGVAARTGDGGGPILAARVEHLGAKEALLADDPRVYFTTAHFDGYPAVLTRLQRITAEDLRELVTEAWLARAPQPLVKAFLEGPR